MKSISERKKIDPVSVYFSDAWWSDMKKNWFKYLLKLVMLLLIFWLIWMAIAPLLSFQPWFSWWRSHDGGKYSKWCFSFVKLSYWKYFKIYYSIGQFLSGADSSFKNPGQAQFIMMLLTSYAVDIVTDGHLTPKALCNSIIPDTLISGSYPSADTLNIIKSCIEWNSNDWPDVSKTGKEQGIQMWQYIIASWGGAGTSSITWDKQNFKCNTGNTPNTSGNFEAWVSAPDNFLYTWYGIKYDCLAIRAFLSEQATLPNGNPLYKTTIEIMLGFVTASGWTPGGWWGMLRSLTGSDWDYGEYQRIFWEDEVPTIHTMPSCTTSTKINAYLKIPELAGFGVMAGAGAGAMKGSAAGVPGAVIGAIIGAIVGGVGTYSEFKNAGCYDK